MIRVIPFARMINRSCPCPNMSGRQSALVLLLYVSCLEYRLLRHKAFFFASLMVSLFLCRFRSASFTTSSLPRHVLYLSQDPWQFGSAILSSHPLHGHPLLFVRLKLINLPTLPYCTGRASRRDNLPAEAQPSAADIVYTSHTLYRFPYSPRILPWHNQPVP